LKGKRIEITDDLSEEDRIQRRNLLPELVKIKNAGKIAHFKGIHLITKEKETFQVTSPSTPSSTFVPCSQPNLYELKRDCIEEKEEKDESPLQTVEEECNFHTPKEDDEIHSLGEKEIGSTSDEQWTSDDESTTEHEQTLTMKQKGNTHKAFSTRRNESRKKEF